jgi:hypothetical protein
MAWTDAPGDALAEGQAAALADAIAAQEKLRENARDYSAEKIMRDRAAIEDQYRERCAQLDRRANSGLEDLRKQLDRAQAQATALTPAEADAYRAQALRLESVLAHGRLSDALAALEVAKHSGRGGLRAWRESAAILRRWALDQAPEAAGGGVNLQGATVVGVIDANIGAALSACESAADREAARLTEAVALQTTRVAATRGGRRGRQALENAWGGFGQERAFTR